jgi:hypothetical protein
MSEAEPTRSKRTVLVLTTATSVLALQSAMNADPAIAVLRTLGY